MFRFLVTLALIATPVLCYSEGAPSGACNDGVPQHGVDPQKGPAPYDIVLSTNKIRSGDSVQITIKGKKPENTFKGLLVQAKVGNTAVGKFDVAASDKFIQTLDCGNGKGSGVTHKKLEKGVPSVTFNWTAPKGLSEKVTFVATIAYHGGEFWVGHKSAVLSVH